MLCYIKVYDIRKCQIFDLVYPNVYCNLCLSLGSRYIIPTPKQERKEKKKERKKKCEKAETEEIAKRENNSNISNWA